MFKAITLIELESNGIVCCNMKINYLAALLPLTVQHHGIYRHLKQVAAYA